MGTYGHRLKAEPTKSLTTLLGLGQESLVNGPEGFFPDPISASSYLLCGSCILFIIVLVAFYLASGVY